jgi:hypothetical protein
VCFDAEVGVGESVVYRLLRWCQTPEFEQKMAQIRIMAKLLVRQKELVVDDDTNSYICM